MPPWNTSTLQITHLEWCILTEYRTEYINTEEKKTSVCISQLLFHATCASRENISKWVSHSSSCWCCGKSFPQLRVQLLWPQHHIGCCIMQIKISQACGLVAWQSDRAYVWIWLLKCMRMCQSACLKMCKLIYKCSKCVWTCVRVCMNKLFCNYTKVCISILHSSPWGQRERIDLNLLPYVHYVVEYLFYDRMSVCTLRWE